MRNTEARNILGLDPGDDPRAFLSAFEETIDYKQELVNNAPSQEIRFRYQQELLEYKAAVQVIGGKQKIRPHTDFVVVLLLIASFSSVGWWGYQWYQEQWNAHARNEVIIAQLQADGRIAVIGRKWDVAEKAYRKIQDLDPGSPVAATGFESIKRGQQEERSQQLFYTLGESQAALEAGRWAEAERLARAVLTQNPGNESARRKLEMISDGRRKQDISLKMMAIADALDLGKLPDARQALADLRQTDPQNPNLSIFAKRIATEDARIKQRLDKARDLYQQALQLDTGAYSPKALTLLDDARRLNPGSQEIRALHRKMSAYTRALHVPGDFPTIAKALEAARPRDLIRIAAGTYKEALVIDQPIRLEGSADGKTILELPCMEASIITLTRNATGSRISGLDLKHRGFDHGKDRFSGITVEARDVVISACNVHHSAGHGIAVVSGASATITGCKITACGWDGVTAYGAGSHVTLVDTLCQGNLQHGMGFWLGGSGSVTSSRMLKNGLCGIVAMSKGTVVKVKSSTCSNNREAGILVANGVTATLDSNRCEKNLLSGVVARGDGTSVSLTNNTVQGNREAGILTHLGVQVSKFENNQAHGNALRQIWRNAALKK